MKQILAIAVGCVIFSGCFSVRYRSSVLELSNTDLCQTVEESVRTSSVEWGCEPPVKWWEMFSDPQLDIFIELALACHPTIKVAEYRLALAYEIAMEARSKLLPHFNLMGSYERQKLSLYGFGIPALVPLLEGQNLLFNLAQLFLEGTYTLDIWGKNHALFKAKKEETRAVQAELEESRLLLSTTIATLYCTLQSHFQQLAILKKHVQDRREIFALLKQRYSQGISSEFFLYEEDTQIALLEDRVQEMEGIITTDKHALAALVGNATPLCDICIDMEVVPVAQFEQPFPLPARIPLNLLIRRPDIWAQIWRIHAAGSYVKAAKARFLPDIDLFASIGSASFLLTKFFSDESIQVEGEAVGVLPLYRGGELRAGLGQSQASLEIAVQSYNALVLRAVQEVSDALSQLITADERRHEMAMAIKNALELERLTTTKFDHGIETWVSVLNARSNVLVQQLKAAQIELKRMEAIVSLIRSIGGGYGGGSEEP